MLEWWLSNLAAYSNPLGNLNNAETQYTSCQCNQNCWKWDPGSSTFKRPSKGTDVQTRLIHRSRQPFPQSSTRPGDWFKDALILSKSESAGSLEPSWTRSELPGRSKKSWERLKAHLGGRWWGVRSGSVRLQTCTHAPYWISNHTLWKFIRILSQRHFISLPANSHQEHVFSLLPEGFSIQIMTFLHSHRATNFQNLTMFKNLAIK